MTPYRFAVSRILFGFFYLIYLSEMLMQSSIKESEPIYWGLIGLTALFTLGYRRALLARSLIFFSYLLFALENNLLHLNSILVLFTTLFFALADGSEPWKIKSSETVSKNSELALDQRQLSRLLILEFILIASLFATALIFPDTVQVNWHSGTTWFLSGFFLITTIPDFLFKSNPDSKSPLLFFDGVCGLCNNVVDFIFAEDTAGIIKVSPLQGEQAKEQLAESLRLDLNTVVLVDQDGQIYKKSEAIFNVLYAIGGFWKLFFILRLLPRPLCDVFYDLIAKYRYKIFGKTETCRLPTPAERSRFVD